MPTHALYESQRGKEGKDAHQEVEGQRVNGDGVLAGVVLHHTRQESLGEEKPRHPEQTGFISVIPGL